MPPGIIPVPRSKKRFGSSTTSTVQYKQYKNRRPELSWTFCHPGGKKPVQEFADCGGKNRTRKQKIEPAHCTDQRFCNSFWNLSFISLYIYFRILETLKGKNMSPKVSVKEAILELSKIYAMVHGARVSLAEIPEKSPNMADLFELKLSPKVLRN